MDTKWIVITGGVISGLGKGVASASIGNLLTTKYNIVPIKCDGYLNVDPGTINPIEHGEVFVLDDGGEVDMDFGHYERFLNTSCSFSQNLTMGKVFQEIRRKERKGDYLGQTVQFIPHVTDLIKERWLAIAGEKKADIVIIEIGGTVGDIENELFIEAARQLKYDVGIHNIMYIHLTYIPIPSGVKEQKSKPTQQSVNLLRMKGITPDILIGRCSNYLEEKIKKKIAIFCDVNPNRVITSPDINNIYELPRIFEKQGILKIIEEHLGIDKIRKNEEWNILVDNMEKPIKEVNIAICGKYTALEDSYASVVEALKHAGAHFKTKVNIKWIETSGNFDPAKELKEVQGVIVPGGFGSRGIEGKIKVAEYCRKHNIPYLGLCLGLQIAVIEFARNVCKLKDANSTEFNEKTPYPVVDILPEQKALEDKGGTMRLGSYEALLKKGTKTFTLYGKERVLERHRHRYEVNPEYHKILEDKGLVFAGISLDGRLVEFIELKNHKYFIATQSHPELKSSLLKPAPLFYGLVEAALKK